MTMQIKNVLLVEDNEYDVKRVERGFKKLSDPRQIVRAHDGVEAMQILRGEGEVVAPQPPFVILLDLNMPRMGGIELLDHMHDANMLGCQQIFVVTTSDFHSDIENAYARGIAGYFVKPETAEEMVTILDKASQFWDLCEIPA